jgi:aromatic ring hydroxylase
MLKSGHDFLKGLRDGRRVYVGGEQVEDIAAHPGFRGGAASLAALYDWKADPAQRGLLSFTEDGDDYSMWFLRPHRAQLLGMPRSPGRYRKRKRRKHGASRPVQQSGHDSKD